MSSTLSGAPAQESAAVAFANRTDLVRRIIKESQYRTFRVRATVGYDRLPDNELAEYALSALGHGFYRALIEKFSDTRKLTPQWWAEHRRAATGHGKDRTADLSIIVEQFPEFREFYVTLTDDEVVQAAKVEFYDMIAAVGTDYHQIEAQRKHNGAGDAIVLSQKSLKHSTTVPAGLPDVQAILLDAESGSVDFMDPTAQDAVENVLALSALNDERDPLGPVVTRVATIALREYGTNGLFWLLERLFLPTRFTEVLRAIGGNEEELGKSEFERIKRDMVRKLPEVHERMMMLLRDDPDMLQLREMVWATAKPSSPAPTSIGHAVATKERERYVERHRAGLLRRLQSDGEDVLAESLAGFTAAAITPCVHEYVKAINNSDPTAWPTLKAKLHKVTEARAA